jgi:rhodanese-related sulfurtransferase
MQTLSTQQLEQLRRDKPDVPVINVLSEDNYRKAHIPETDNVPLDSDNFIEQVESKAGSKENEVVVYCASPECDASPKAAKKLEEAGFQNVYDYEGGTKAWKESGHQTVGQV